MLGNINRNDLCPCGSGKKYKKCCLGSSEVQPAAKVEPGNNDWGKQSRGREQDTEIDRFIIQGYDELDKQDSAGACRAWGRVWDHFLLRLSPGMTSCEQTLPVYDGSFLLKNWIQDFCAALHVTALKDADLAPGGAGYCTQVLLQFPDEDENLQNNFRASLGEFHFLAGQQAEGEKVLSALIADYPHKAIGYAYLADMFGEERFNTENDHPIDLNRAIDILEYGLAHPVEDADDFNLQKRLDWFKESTES